MINRLGMISSFRQVILFGGTRDLTGRLKGSDFAPCGETECAMVFFQPVNLVGAASGGSRTSCPGVCSTMVFRLVRCWGLFSAMGNGHSRSAAASDRLGQWRMRALQQTDTLFRRGSKQRVSHRAGTRPRKPKDHCWADDPIAVSRFRSTRGRLWIALRSPHQFRKTVSRSSAISITPLIPHFASCDRYHRHA